VGVALEVLADGRAPLVRADDQLRAAARAVDRVGGAARGDAPSDGDRRPASGPIWNWYVFRGIPLLGFLLFTISGYAETNRVPFDLPEAEGELVAGYHTEYSGMRFAAFFMAEYVNMITSSALGVTLFLGGWQLGFPVPFEGWPLWILQILAFIGKLAFFQFLFVWVRWTLPRFRYDQLMNLGWKGLFPLSLVNLATTAVLVTLNFNVAR
jgi:NADH-quinone oxidoreductase subunit H